MIEFRDWYAKHVGAELIVHKNQKALDDGANPFALGTQKCCGLLKTRSLLDGLAEGGFDAAFGGARRDEEKSRAKERVYSFRDSLGQWDPKNQRPELWNLFNSRHHKGESIRVFPLSNWTEMDVWLYIHAENIPIVPLYFAKEREAVVRGEFRFCSCRHGVRLLPGEKTADGEVPHALARMRALHRRDPLRRGHGAQDHRGDDFVPPLGARKSRDRPRRRRLDGNQEARGIFLMATRSRAGLSIRAASRHGVRRKRCSCAAGYRAHRTDLLRFTTAGSVDDGKSTLIGRLLYDSQVRFRRPARLRAEEQDQSLRRPH